MSVRANKVAKWKIGLRVKHNASYGKIAEKCKISLKIPARSLDLNPIGNIFHIVKCSLPEGAMNKRIETESFAQFQDRVVCALNLISCDVIDKTIESLLKRSKFEAIIKSGGYRSKY